jgi:hypothetical protein
MPVTFRYALAPRAIALRARMVALSGAAVAVAPAWLVLALVAQLGLASRIVVIAVAIAIGALGVARGLVAYGQAKQRLTSLVIEAGEGELTVTTARGATCIPAAGITRVTEVDGAYGGLRVELTPESTPSRFDVPRGGEAFGDLRAWLSSRTPIERTARRGLPARIALAVGVVLALFFVPFVVADARGSRVAVAIVLLAAWGAMRAVAARG